MTVPRLPKQEAAKVDFSSHCAILLLNTHTHPKVHIPKFYETCSDNVIRDKGCRPTTECKMSTRGVVDKH